MCDAPDRNTEIQSYLSRLTQALQEISVTDLACVANALERAYLADRTIYLCGNGGSAATASHLAVDLSKSTRLPHVPPVRTVSLVDHVPALTAWANDVSYDAVFSGQLAGLARPGDVVVGITTSGRSPNVVNALAFGRETGMTTVGLLGPHGGPARELCDVCVLAPGASIEEQEDLHMSVAHILTRHMRDFVGSPDRSPVALGVAAAQ